MFSSFQWLLWLKTNSWFWARRQNPSHDSFPKHMCSLLCYVDSLMLRKLKLCRAIHIWRRQIFFVRSNPIILSFYIVTISSTFFCFPWGSKGQTKLKFFFQADVSSIKRTNEFYFTTMNPHFDLFSFVFGRNWRHQKDILKLTALYKQPILRKLVSTFLAIRCSLKPLK